MKRFFFSLMLTTLATAQESSFTDFVAGSALPGEGQVTFYLENLSSCVLEEIQIRVAPDKAYNTTEGTTFITQLQPKTQGTFVMRLNQPVTNMGWTIDALTLAQPQDNPTCPQIGLVTFKKAAFGDAPPPTAQTGTPTPEINRAVTREYTVVAGDSWWGIAQRFGTTPDVMAQLNNRTDTNLKVGEVLKVPAPAAPPPLEQTAAQTETATSGNVASGGEPTAAPQGFTAYTVQQGDTLFGIAKTLETSVALIRQANCLSEDTVLNVNQVLQIPPKDAQLTNTCN
jgi:LysM repeat protein